MTLSSTRLGLIAKMDLIEAEGRVVTPIDYKRGKRPHIKQGAYDPERVQLCVQGMILEEHGYECPEGILYFAESRERVRVAFDDELRVLTLNAVDGLRLMASGGRIPVPLQDSPKCPRCSLVGICLPDEVNFFRNAETPPRPLAVANDSALPVYVQARGAKVAKKGETLEISIDDKPVQSARADRCFAAGTDGQRVYLTAPALHELMTREIPVSWHSFGGWFLGHTIGTGHKNVEIRTAQYKAQLRSTELPATGQGLRHRQDPETSELCCDATGSPSCPCDDVIELMKSDIRLAQRAADLQELLGAEGLAGVQIFRTISLPC